jgi:hypothetical protein
VAAGPVACERAGVQRPTADPAAASAADAPEPAAFVLYDDDHDDHDDHDHDAATAGAGVGGVGIMTQDESPSRGRRGARGRRLRVGRRVVLALVLAVSALGASTGVSSSSPSGYARSVCRSFAAWQRRLVKLATPSGQTPATPEAIKGRLVVYFSGAVKAGDTLIRDLQHAGVPSVAHGRVIAGDVVRATRHARAALSGAAHDAKRLPTNTPQAFTAAADRLGVLLTDAGSASSAMIDQITARYHATSLEQAFTASPACKPGT